MSVPIEAKNFVPPVAVSCDKAHEKQIPRVAAITGLVICLIGTTILVASLIECSRFSVVPGMEGIVREMQRRCVCVGLPMMCGGELLGLWGAGTLYKQSLAAAKTGKEEENKYQGKL